MSNKKVLAFYLPQFHTFKENDEWWGKGFTEWTNTTKAKPLFPAHNQPRTPYNNNYYDLSKKENIIWQMNLANKYGLYGFCFYHYWFNGKVLMEKPLRIMRELDERLPYCFCWANEPWTRAWDGKDKEVLMPQYYGGEKEWSQHFDYLMDFFSDEKYIKIDNKPVLLLYQAQSINNCEKMIAYMDEMCVQKGFSGIYIIEERNTFQSVKYCKNSAAIVDFEPMYTMKYGRSIGLRAIDKLKATIFNRKYCSNMLIYSYDKVWQSIIRRAKNEKSECKKYLGAFVDWDNFARKGKNGIMFYGTSPEKFGKYLKKLITECKNENGDYIFINAWNEWAEGTYLEPDTKWSYDYLKQMSLAINTDRMSEDNK